MERDPKDKVVVVTGGATGIGYAIVESFLKNGAKTVIILDVNDKTIAEDLQKLNGTYGEGKAVFIKCDVTKDLETVSSQIFQDYQVDVLVNNAGILNEKALRKVIEVNCIAVMEWSMKFYEHMRKDKGGHGGTIYNMASTYGYEYNPWVVIYKTSKHAIMGFTRSLGHPYNNEKTGVRVIAICPGYTDTPILEFWNLWDWHKEDFDKEVASQIIQKVERVGEAAIEIFKVADTGTAWVAKNNQPIELAPTCKIIN